MRTMYQPVCVIFLRRCDCVVVTVSDFVCMQECVSVHVFVSCVCVCVLLYARERV